MCIFPIVIKEWEIQSFFFIICQAKNMLLLQPLQQILMKQQKKRHTNGVKIIRSTGYARVLLSLYLIRFIFSQCSHNCPYVVATHTPCIQRPPMAQWKNGCTDQLKIIQSFRCTGATIMLSTQFCKFFIGQSWQLPSSPVSFVLQHVPSPLQFLTAFVKLLPITPCIHPAANSKGK